ncbi:MAG: MerR family transcriptional regulator [Rickettsiales endosymbiont of Dermacentor nuttalli]
MIKEQDKIPVNLSSIGEVAKFLNVQQSVLRFWEKKFSNIKVHKINGRRYYDSNTIAIIQNIKELLYNKGYTIKGAQSFLDDKHNTTLEIKHSQTNVVNVDKNQEKLSEILVKLKNIKAKLEAVMNIETDSVGIE